MYVSFMVSIPCGPLVVICSLYIFVEWEISWAKTIYTKQKKEVKILNMFLQLVKSKNPIGPLQLGYHVN